MLCRNVLETIKETLWAGVNGDCPTHTGRPEPYSSAACSSWYIMGIAVKTSPLGQTRKS